MHELPLTNKILEIALDHANRNNAAEVKEIILCIGKLTDIEEYWMNHYFSWISKNTLASGAKLIINKIPVEWQCDECLFVFTLDNSEDASLICPQCGENKNLTLIHGREFMVEAITII